MTFSDCTADLVGQLNGNGQKGMLQIDSLSKISGYATGRDAISPSFNQIRCHALLDFTYAAKKTYRNQRT